MGPFLPKPSDADDENAAVPAAVDRTRLAHLATQLGRAGYVRLMNRFGPASQIELERLTVAVDSGRPDAIRRAAHRIAGFAANFGASGLARLARELEANPEAARELAPRMRDSARSTESALSLDVEHRGALERVE